MGFNSGFKGLRVHICAECSQSIPLHTEAVGTQHPTKLDVSQPEISHTKPSPLSTIHTSNLSWFSSFLLSKCWNATACLKCAWPLPITCSSTYHSTLHNFCSWKSVVKAKKKQYGIIRSRSGYFTPGEKTSIEQELVWAWIRTRAPQLVKNPETRANMCLLASFEAKARGEEQKNAVCLVVGPSPR